MHSRRGRQPLLVLRGVPVRDATAHPFAPGRRARSVVDLVAPAQRGTYRLRPVVDGVAWPEDTGAYVDHSVR